ncbi:MAG: hypothetical protein NWE85_06625 [Candidatus Bathyarchaeota archaeon]|nr:hypothetical protein [Candidatus Bathyarchaeota archaeon]
MKNEKNRFKEKAHPKKFSVASYSHHSRVLRIGAEPKSTSNLQVSRKGLHDTFLTYDELRKINAQLLKMEMQKAEARRLIREKNRCV